MLSVSAPAAPRCVATAIACATPCTRRHNSPSRAAAFCAVWRCTWSRTMSLTRSSWRMASTATSRDASSAAISTTCRFRCASASTRPPIGRAGAPLAPTPACRCVRCNGTDALTRSPRPRELVDTASHGDTEHRSAAPGASAPESRRKEESRMVSSCRCSSCVRCERRSSSSSKAWACCRSCVKRHRKHCASTPDRKERQRSCRISGGAVCDRSSGAPCPRLLSAMIASASARPSSRATNVSSNTLIVAAIVAAIGNSLLCAALHSTLLPVRSESRDAFGLGVGPCGWAADAVEAELQHGEPACDSSSTSSKAACPEDHVAPIDSKRPSGGCRLNCRRAIANSRCNRPTSGSKSSEE
mmetsp:Transcript_33208/g.95323  ORF Transcript_33208/g.95323 Transcript_33208/m.95323 type:complete len:357 (+) Transcript_33208:270-1340(+)